MVQWAIKNYWFIIFRVIEGYLRFTIVVMKKAILVTRMGYEYRFFHYLSYESNQLFRLLFIFSMKYDKNSSSIKD
ncbi:MAG: hypothetical protein K6T88_09295 [Bacillus sp. (in: Bacteria)]|nr:hypothetical protein [Bacillus sp. (in: firmicutes)]